MPHLLPFFSFEVPNLHISPATLNSPRWLNLPSCCCFSNHSLDKRRICSPLLSSKLKFRFIALFVCFRLVVGVNSEGVVQTVYSYLEFPSEVVKIWIGLADIYLAATWTTSACRQVAFLLRYGRHLVSNGLASILQTFCFGFAATDPSACSQLIIGRFVPYLFVDLIVASCNSLPDNSSFGPSLIYHVLVLPIFAEGSQYSWLVRCFSTGLLDDAGRFAEDVWPFWEDSISRLFIKLALTQDHHISFEFQPFVLWFASLKPSTSQFLSSWSQDSSQSLFDTCPATEDSNFAALPFAGRSQQS